MRVLILHRVPYHKIGYDRGIDHNRHDVTYIGTEDALKNIPEHLRCEKLARPGKDKTSVEVLGVLSALGQQVSFDRVLSLSEYELLDAAEVRAALKIKGPTCENVLLVRDKLRMKKAVARAGVTVPRNISCLDLAECDWTGKTVLKPVAGASSENVFVYSSREEAIRAVWGKKVPIPKFDPAAYELEEFIEGPILHIDGLMRSGKLIVGLASKYIGTCLDFAKGEPLASIQLDAGPDHEALLDWATRCLRAVKIRTGSFHLEAILSDKGPVFLEVGARVGGADVVDTFELATGVHLPLAELKLILGRDRGSMASLFTDERFGWFVFPGHHYSFSQIYTTGTEVFREHPQIVRWNELTPDKPLPRKITYQAIEVPIAGVIRGPSAAKLEEFIQKLFSEIKVQEVFLEEKVQ